jgi:hypothetical protein
VEDDLVLAASQISAHIEAQDWLIAAAFYLFSQKRTTTFAFAYRNAAWWFHLGILCYSKM